MSLPARWIPQGLSNAHPRLCEQTFLARVQAFAKRADLSGGVFNNREVVSNFKEVPLVMVWVCYS
jgi:hypothetical protein